MWLRYELDLLVDNTSKTVAVMFDGQNPDGDRNPDEDFGELQQITVRPPAVTFSEYQIGDPTQMTMVLQRDGQVQPTYICTSPRRNVVFLGNQIERIYKNSRLLFTIGSDDPKPWRVQLKVVGNHLRFVEIA